MLNKANNRKQISIGLTSAKFQCNVFARLVKFLSLRLLGPKTQALFNLQDRVGELPQLRQSKHRFNAFLLGLLK